MYKVVELSELEPVKTRFTLDGKKALITGAGGGIGRSTAAAIAELGADVILTDIRIDKAHDSAEYISKKFGVKAMAFACDISDETQVNSLFKHIKNEFETLDCVHSNAGAISGEGDHGDMSYEEWQKLMNINLTGMFLINRNSCQLMCDQGKGGAIVNTASISGHIINRSTTRHAVCYPAAKAAVLHMTKGFAADFAKAGIRVNSISPGNMYSGMWHYPAEEMQRMENECPMGRLGNMNDIVGAVVFLLTDLATYITGTDLLVDGGYTLW